MLMGWTLGRALGVCVGPLVQIIIIIFYYLFFESISLYIAIIFEPMCLFSNIYMHSPSFMKIIFLQKLFQREFFVHSFESKREKETQSSSQSKDVVCFFFVLQIILSQEADIRGSQSTTNCVRGEICFKKIVSNTRLDLIHSSFTQLVCEFLIICKFLLIYTVSIYCFYLSHLFVLLLIIRCMLFFFA